MKEFTGISAAYEPPHKPDLNIDTSRDTLTEHIEKMLRWVIVGQVGRSMGEME